MEEEESSDFAAGVYYPELLWTMGALDAAWEAFEPKPKDADFARLLMASAIVDAIDGGVRKHEFLVGKAIGGLTAAMEADREVLEPTAMAAR